MSYLQRVSVSLPLADQTIDPAAAIPVFHDWIRRGAVEGTLIDVARYCHVHQGPGIMLIGHEGDYSLDLSGGRLSLRYTLKRDNEGTNRQIIARAARRVAGARDELAAAPGWSCAGGDVTVTVADRLNAPNTADGVAAFGPVATAVVTEVFGAGKLDTQSIETDPRAPLSLRIAGAA